MKTIILGTAHLKSTPGKCSPDKKFFEYEYSRKVCKAIKEELLNLGYNCIIDVEEDDLKSKELPYRCQFVNKYKNCIYISIHVNAAASDGKWHNATGWEVYHFTGTKSPLAESLNNSAKINLKGKKLRGIKEANFYVLKHTKCPAVLTENFFQDTKEDVDYLTSEEGFKQIVKTHVDGIINYLANEL